VHIHRLRVLASIALSMIWPTFIQSQTREFLSAPRVADQLQIRLEGKKVRYSLEMSQNFRDITPDQIFLASSTIKLTYPNLNPLKIQVTAAVSETDDPGYAAVAKLIDALIGFPSVLKPTSTGQTGRDLIVSCGAVDAALDNIQTLDRTLYSGRTHDGPGALGPASLPYQLGQWTSDIDDQFKDVNASGSSAVQVAIDKIKIYETAIAVDIKGAADAIASVDKQAELAPTTDCEKKAKYINEAIRLTNPQRRLQELKHLSETLKALETSLIDNYEPEDKWLNERYYIVQDLTPKSDKAQKIVAKVIGNKLEVSPADGSIVISKQDLGSATFTLREFSRFAPEVGAGLVVAFVNQPK
jgi:hypothetical protein